MTDLFKQLLRGEGYLASKLAEPTIGPPLPPCGNPDANRSSVAPKFVVPRLTRYQGIIDVLLDSGCFNWVFFDHDTELPDPYRGRALRKRNALQEDPGKGRSLHKKWADVVGVRGRSCDIVIEEERMPAAGKIEVEVGIITRCRYLWTDGRQFALTKPYLFVVIDGEGYESMPSVRERVGTFDKVIVCRKIDFGEMFRRHYLSGRQPP